MKVLYENILNIAYTTWKWKMTKRASHPNPNPHPYPNPHPHPHPHTHTPTPPTHTHTTRHTPHTTHTRFCPSGNPAHFPVDASIDNEITINSTKFRVWNWIYNAVVMDIGSYLYLNLIGKFDDSINIGFLDIFYCHAILVTFKRWISTLHSFLFKYFHIQTTCTKTSNLIMNN